MAYKYRALIAVCFGSYMATMDFSIVQVALPELAREFDTSADNVVWVSLVSSLMVTGLTLTAGRSGDLFGRKRVYLAGWVIFTIGMGVGSLTTTLSQLIAARVLQSIGVALAIANGNAIVTAAFPDSERGRALGTTGAVVGAGLMSGPLLGGLILSVFDWQAIFWLRIPIGLISMGLALGLLREVRPAGARTQRLDIPGAVTLFVSLCATLLAVNRGQQWGWASAPIVALLVVGVLALLTFIAVESRVPSPVVSLALFRSRDFTIGVLSLALNFAGQASTTFLMSFYVINVLDRSSAYAGLIIATVPLMMLVLSPVSGWASDRFRFTHQTTFGIAFVAVGLLSLSTLGLDTSAPAMMIRLALIGIGTAVFMSPNSSGIMASVPRSMLGTGSAAVATARNIGNATGLAIASAVLVSVAASSAGVDRRVPIRELPPAALLEGVQAAFVVAGCVSGLAILASAMRRRVASGEPATIQPAGVPAGD